MQPPRPRETDGTGGDGAVVDSKWRVLRDLAWGHALLWVASFGRDVTPLPGTHLFFADCYLRLADIDERAGVLSRLGALRSKAAWHIAAAGPFPDDEPPPAAAMAMRAPLPADLVDARAHAAPSVRTPFPRGPRPANSPSGG